MSQMYKMVDKHINTIELIINYPVIVETSVDKGVLVMCLHCGCVVFSCDIRTVCVCVCMQCLAGWHV